MSRPLEIEARASGARALTMLAQSSRLRPSRRSRAPERSGSVLDIAADETAISAALVRAAADLHASLDHARILRQHCSLSREMLDCASAHSYLLDAERDAFVLRARSGDAARCDLAELSRQQATSLLEALECAKTAATGDAGATHLTRLVRHLGGDAGIAVAIRRGRKLIGFHLTCHRAPSAAWDPTKRGIALGLARIAGLALENARRHEELARLSRNRFELLSVLSHELREPLHVILGFSGLLLDGDLGRLEPQQHDAACRIGRNARRLADLIENTLCVTRTEVVENPAGACQIVLSDLVAELLQESLASHTKPAVRLTSDVPVGLPPLHADPARLKMVLRNLIGNAVKFTDEGEVRVALSRRGDGIDLVVSDTGPGIAPELREAIFEPFRQGAGPHDAARGGVGLGLYIVRRMLEHLDGTISLESELGRGSTFRFWVPLRGSSGRRA